MRNVRLVSTVIVLSSAGLWSQQTPAPNPHDTLPPAIRDPHSTKADLAIPLCPAKFDDSLDTDRIADLSRDVSVTLPKLLYSPGPEFSEEARRQKRRGQFNVVLVAVVNTVGGTQNICLMESAGYGLDAKATEAVQKYRFEPASKDGKRVAARVSLTVKFHLY